MRPLPLVAPDGCTLSAEGLEQQFGRAGRLAPAVLGTSRSGSELSVAFAPEVDHDLVHELVATERGCCSFLELDYAVGSRVLRIGSDDPRGIDVMDRLEEVLAAR